MTVLPTRQPRLGSCLALLGALLAASPGAAQELRAHPLPPRPTWLTAAAVGPSFPIGPVATQANSGIALSTTLEYGFRRPQGLWLRGTLDAIQFSATQQLAGPGYAYSLKLSNTLTSLVVDVGYRRAYGRLGPYAFVGAGGSYFSSSQLDGEQAGQAQHLGASSGYAPTVRAGAGLEYRLYRARLIPYVEVMAQAVPGQNVGGERLFFLTPLVGIKFPL